MQVQLQDTLLKASVSRSVSTLFNLTDLELRRLLLTKDVSALLNSPEKKTNNSLLLRQDNDEALTIHPYIYMAQNIIGVEAERQLGNALWALISDLYINPENDRADLSAWLNEGLNFNLLRTPRLALIKASKAYGVMPLYSKEYGHLTAVASFSKTLHDNR